MQRKDHSKKAAVFKSREEGLTPETNLGTLFLDYLFIELQGNILLLLRTPKSVAFVTAAGATEEYAKAHCLHLTTHYVDNPPLTLTW